MANRRMFSKSITNSGKFLKMPPTSRLLYYDFGMNADDDGYVEWFTILKMTSSTEQDMKVLQANKFIEVFDDNVLVILDWKENNQIRQDRYLPSKYKAVYGLPNGNQMATKGKPRLGKVRIGKISTVVAKATEQPLEVKEFNSKESVSNLLKDESRDIKILGYYFMRKGMVFSSQKELSQAIAVNRSMINAFTKKNGMHPFESIPSEKILKAMDYAKEKFPDWSLKVIMERCYEIGK